MKKMMEMTKLVSKNSNEELYVFIALEDFKKYVFVKKGNLFIPYNDKKLLDILNNADKVMYHQSNEEEKEESKKKKHKLTLKEKMQRTLAGLGVAVTLITCTPQILEGVNYSLKRVKSFSHCILIDEKTSNDGFMDQFAIAINKNPDYKEEEKEGMINGYKKYIDDWGYLLDEIDKEYILYMAQNVNIIRNSQELPKYATGMYGFGKIECGTKASKSVVSHEVCHAFSDRGLLVGTLYGYGFGYAANEGINTSVNDKYLASDSSYRKEREDVFKLSLLIDNEVLMEAYQKKGSDYLCRMMVEKNPNIKYSDIVKYLTMMDINVHLNTYEKIEGYSLPPNFFEEKDELYNKMFRAKYGYDYSESVMNYLTRELDINDWNFLDENIICSKTDGFVVKYYKIPKELLTSKSSEFDYEKYFVEEKKDFNESYAPLEFLVSFNEIKSYDSWDEFCVAFANKHFLPEEELDKVKAVFTQKLCEENFDYYMKYALDKVLEMEQSPEFIACYIKKVRDVVKSEAGESIENFDEKFTTKTNEFLIQNNMEEVFSFYNNSTIEFEKFSYYDMDSCVLPEEYEIIHSTDDYMIMEDGLLVLKVSEGDTLWDAKYGEEETLYLSEMSEDVSEQYDQIFGSSEGKYYYAYLYRELNAETIENDKINIYISSICKTQSLQNGNNSK